MYDQNLDKPIRTRGAAPAANDQPNRTRGAVRVRSAIRTRGASNSGASSGEHQPLHELVEELRLESESFPLTVLIHNAASALADEFLQALRLSLHADDALWLVVLQGAASVTKPSDAVVLFLEDETEQRLHNNLVADIVFFPGASNAEVEAVTGWKDRASRIVIGHGSQYSDLVLNSARAAGMRASRWPL